MHIAETPEVRNARLKVARATKTGDKTEIREARRVWALAQAAAMRAEADRLIASAAH